MNKGLFLINQSEPLEAYRSNGVRVFETALHLWDKPSPVFIGIDKPFATLADIVPLTRALCDQLCSGVIEHVARRNQHVNCQKGCSSCCSYLVALSLPEVFYLQKELASMNADVRCHFMKSCLPAARQILDVNRLKAHRIDQHAELSTISRWYTEMGLSCPFLDDGLCSIYDSRPLACREHMVVSLPEYCQINQVHGPDIVDLPIRLDEVLGELAADIEGGEVEGVLLPLAVVCGDHYRLRSTHQWPADLLVERFIHLIQKTLDRPLVAGQSEQSA